MCIRDRLSRGARARSTKQKAHIDRIKAMKEIRDIQEERRVAMNSVASSIGLLYTSRCV